MFAEIIHKKIAISEDEISIAVAGYDAASAGTLSVAQDSLVSLDKLLIAHNNPKPTAVAPIPEHYSCKINNIVPIKPPVVVE